MLGMQQIISFAVSTLDMINLLYAVVSFVIGQYILQVRKPISGLDHFV